MAENPMLEIYLNYSERLDKLRDRRQTENRFFLSIISALIVSGSYLLLNTNPSLPYTGAITAFLISLFIFILLIWQLTLTTYRSSAKAMHLVLRDIEKEANRNRAFFPCDKMHYKYLTGKDPEDSRSAAPIHKRKWHYEVRTGSKNLYPGLFLSFFIGFLVGWLFIK